MSKTITSAEYNAWLEHPLTKGLKRSFQQSITDPENQPSQYGTVTLEMYEALEDQLAAEQLNNKLLRDALQEYIDEHEECQDADDWMAMMCSMEAHHTADEALATQTDTSALDAYVAEKVKETADEHRKATLLRFEQTQELTRQRDLAVEALENLARLGNGDRYGNSVGNTIAQQALSTIKGSEK